MSTQLRVRVKKKAKSISIAADLETFQIIIRTILIKKFDIEDLNSKQDL